MIPAERRRCPRVPFTGVAIVRIGRKEIPCLAHNLSASGMLVFPRRVDCDPGVDFRVTFVLPQTGKWLDLDARLVRRTRVYHKVAWAVQFIQVPSTIQRVLRRYVYSSVSTSSALSRIPTHPVDAMPSPSRVFRARKRRTTARWRESVTQSYPPRRRRPRDNGSD